MPRKTEHKKAMLKAGLFIILTLSLLAFSLLWLRHFSLIPDKTIVVRFFEPGPISKGLPIYYQGVHVGKISDIGFSDDYKTTLVKSEIFKKNLDLPQNIHGEMRAEGLTGQKYLALIYPEAPVGNILKDGDIIDGRPSQMKEIQDYLRKNFEKEDIKNTLENVQQTLANSKDISAKVNLMVDKLGKFIEENEKKVNKIIKDSSLVAADVRYTTSVIKDFSAKPENELGLKKTLENTAQSSENWKDASKGLNEIASNQDFQTGVVNTASGLGKVVGKVDKTIEHFEESSPQARTFLDEAGNLLNTTSNFIRNTDCRTGRLFEQIENSGVISNSSFAMYKVGMTADSAQCAIDRINETQFDGKLNSMIFKTICDADRTINRYDFIAKNFCDLMSKRFLLFRLMFGCPGKNFQNCGDVENCMQHIFNAQNPKSSP